MTNSDVRTVEVELLRELIAELRGLRADLRAGNRHSRRNSPDDLVAQLEDHFGAGDITVAAVLTEVDDDPHGRLARAVGAVIDLNNAAGRSTRLGQVLAGLDGLELVTTRRNAAVYRVNLSSQG